MARWMLVRKPLLALYYFSDILIPFAIVGCVLGWVATAFVSTEFDLYANVALTPTARGQLAIVGLAVVMSALGIAIRYSKHFAKHPRDVLFIPAFMLINSLVLIPIRVVGFFRCAENSGWSTRAGGFRGERVRTVGAIVPPILGAVMLLSSFALAFLPHSGVLG